MSSTWSAAVRYAEVDQQGIVFHAHYLTWADEACTAWFASVGTPYGQLLSDGLDMRVRVSTLDWTASARYGDTVELDVACERIGGSSWTLRAGVRVGERPCCTIRTTYVLVDRAGLPTRIPEGLRAAWADPGTEQ